MQEPYQKYATKTIILAQKTTRATIYLVFQRESCLKRSILAIGDIHAPFSHRDLVPFLTACKKAINPDCVIQVGDEADIHAISRFTPDPNLHSAGDEIEMARKALRPLQDLFPDMQLCESNHGSRVYRRAKEVGLPSQTLRSYKEILDIQVNWQWFDEIVKITPKGPVLFDHGEKATAIQHSKNQAMSVVQGHRHAEQYIQWWANPREQRFGAQVGCMIDQQSFAFAYDKKTSLPRPQLGCLAIIEGEPTLLRMCLTKSGRWDRKLAL